jgi:hypothetical protein
VCMLAEYRVKTAGFCDITVFGTDIL